MVSILDSVLSLIESDFTKVHFVVDDITTFPVPYAEPELFLRKVLNIELTDSFDEIIDGKETVFIKDPYCLKLLDNDRFGEKRVI